MYNNECKRRYRTGFSSSLLLFLFASRPAGRARLVDFSKVSSSRYSSSFSLAPTIYSLFLRHACVLCVTALPLSTCSGTNTQTDRHVRIYSNILPSRGCVSVCLSSPPVRLTDLSAFRHAAAVAAALPDREGFTGFSKRQQVERERELVQEYKSMYVRMNGHHLYVCIYIYAYTAIKSQQCLLSSV